MDPDKENAIIHTPVLAEEAISYLAIKKGMIIADCTVGSGGHAEKILNAVEDTGCLIGIDRDAEVLERARLRLSAISDNFRLFHFNYRDLDRVLCLAGIGEIDGAIFDLGVSSFQLDDAERGFGIKRNGPLDMRMDRSEKLTAFDIVNRFSIENLTGIFEKYGDEHFAGRIAGRIARERKKEPIRTTGRLAAVVQDALPYRFRFRKIHPATKVFMALRIALNGEAESLSDGLSKAAAFLKKSSRLVVITFHSIEDRIAKNKFKEMAEAGILKIITRRPIQPGRCEVIKNPRSRSAKLRAAEKI